MTPIPKKKSVKELTKDLCPIYLTPCNSKIAEDFVVCDYVKPQALQILDDDQFGAPKSSTTLAQQEMLHTWTEATDQVVPLSKQSFSITERLSASLIKAFYLVS